MIRPSRLCRARFATERVFHHLPSDPEMSRALGWSSPAHILLLARKPSWLAKRDLFERLGLDYPG